LAIYKGMVIFNVELSLLGCKIYKFSLTIQIPPGNLINTTLSRVEA